MLAGSAHADPSELTLPDRTAVARVVLSSDNRSLSVSPDAWLGVTPKFTIGVTNSTAALDRVESGASVCVVTTDLGCTRRYHGSAVDARYQATPYLAPRLRLLVRDTSPLKPAATVGALARWDRGDGFGLSADPYLQIGLANTDRGNRSALVVPAYLTYQFTHERTAVGLFWLETGYVSDLAVYRDGYHVPLALGFRMFIDDTALSFGGGFTSLLGPQNNVKQREIFVALTRRWPR